MKKNEKVVREEEEDEIGKRKKGSNDGEYWNTSRVRKWDGKSERVSVNKGQKSGEDGQK